MYVWKRSGQIYVKNEQTTAGTSAWHTSNPEDYKGNNLHF